MGRVTFKTIMSKGLAIIGLMAGSAVFAQSQDDSAAAAAPCTGADHRSFDFWLGEWNVMPAGSNQYRASSRISSRHGGCVILEQYNAGAYTGMSINFYDRVSGRWHQTWMANDGAPVYLEGNLDGEGAMVLTDAELPISSATGTINRVTWSTEEGGAVRQFWETSGDGGATWSVAFDGLYTPRESGEAE
jgi:hypothetical protein